MLTRPGGPFLCLSALSRPSRPHLDPIHSHSSLIWCWSAGDGDPITATWTVLAFPRRKQIARESYEFRGSRNRTMTSNAGHGRRPSNPLWRSSSLPNALALLLLFLDPGRHARIFLFVWVCFFLTARVVFVITGGSGGVQQRHAQGSEGVWGWGSRNKPAGSDSVRSGRWAVTGWEDGRPSRISQSLTVGQSRCADTC